MILAKDLENRKIDIAPLCSDSVEQVSVDLSIGSMYKKAGDTDWRHITDKVVISPNSCLLICTEQTIKMPNNAFAFLSSKGSLGAKGILVANTKVDPLFEGKLHIPVFNVGNKKVSLSTKDKFCSLTFLTTEHPIIGNSTRNAVNIEPSDTSKFKDFFSNHTPHAITGVVSILTSVITISLTYLLTKA